MMMIYICQLQVRMSLKLSNYAMLINLHSGIQFRQKWYLGPILPDSAGLYNCVLTLSGNDVSCVTHIPQHNCLDLK